MDISENTPCAKDPFFRSRPFNCKHYGTRIEHKLFFSNSSGAPRISRQKSRDIPPKSLVSLGFEAHTELFGPHPFTWKTPTPPEDIRTKDVWVWVPFSSLQHSSYNSTCRGSRRSSKKGQDYSARGVLLHLSRDRGGAWVGSLRPCRHHTTARKRYLPWPSLPFFSRKGKPQKKVFRVFQTRTIFWGKERKRTQQKQTRNSLGPGTTQNLVVKFDGDISGGVLVENASDDFPEQKKLENLLPNLAGSSPPISPATSSTSLWKSLALNSLKSTQATQCVGAF